MGRLNLSQQCALWHCKLTAERSKIYEVCKKVAGRSREAIAPLCSALRASSGMVSSFLPVLPPPSCARRILTNEQWQRSAGWGSGPCGLHGKGEGTGIVWAWGREVWGQMQSLASVTQMEPCLLYSPLPQQILVHSKKGGTQQSQIAPREIPAKWKELFFITSVSELLIRLLQNLWRFSEVDGRRPWATWSGFESSPALGRRLN